jgi:hypothetical protein
MLSYILLMPPALFLTTYKLLKQFSDFRKNRIGAITKHCHFRRSP